MDIDIKNIKIIPAKIADCRKLSYLKREIWKTTYRGLYPDEKLDNYDYEENTKKFENIIKNPDFHLYVVKYKSEIIGYIGFR